MTKTVVRHEMTDMLYCVSCPQNWTVQYYRSRGLPLEKMAVGVTPVGRVFKLLNATLTYVGAPVDKSAPVTAGDFYLMEGRRAYPEVASLPF